MTNVNDKRWTHFHLFASWGLPDGGMEDYMGYKILEEIAEFVIDREPNVVDVAQVNPDGSLVMVACIYDEEEVFSPSNGGDELADQLNNLLEQFRQEEQNANSV